MNFAFIRSCCQCFVEVFTRSAFSGVFLSYILLFGVALLHGCIDGMDESSSLTKGPWIWIVTFFSHSY